MQSWHWFCTRETHSSDRCQNLSKINANQFGWFFLFDPTCFAKRLKHNAILFELFGFLTFGQSCNDQALAKHFAANFVRITHKCSILISLSFLASVFRWLRDVILKWQLVCQLAVKDLATDVPCHLPICPQRVVSKVIVLAELTAGSTIWQLCVNETDELRAIVRAHKSTGARDRSITKPERRRLKMMMMTTIDIPHLPSCTHQTTLSPAHLHLPCVPARLTRRPWLP